MDISIRDVEKTIRKHAGGDFTGIVVVRFIEGKINACDVGSPSQPMPLLTPTEFAKRAVPQTGPTWRDYLTDEERAELDAAEQDVDNACKLVAERDTAWAAAERRWRDAFHGMWRANPGATNEGQIPLEQQREVNRLRDESNAAIRAYMEAQEIEGHARVEQTRIQRNIYTRCRRRMERDQETPEQRKAHEKPSLRDRLKSAAGKR